MTSQQREGECCPKFDQKSWEGKSWEWKGKMFVKDKVRCLFYMPLNFGTVISRLMKKVETAGAKSVEGMCLSDQTSKWNMDIYVAVDRKIEGADNAEMSGKFLAKVYEGDFRECGKWSQDFETYAKKKGVKISQQFMWYTTCPKCAKKWGKNYVVVVGKVE